MNRLIQKSIFLVALGLALGGLSACGGAPGTPFVQPSAVVLDDPVVLDNPTKGLSARMLPGTSNNVQVTITPSSSSNGATYCVRTNRQEPAATDACFKAETSQTASTLGSATQATPVVIWSKSSAGVVTLAGALAVPGKTCSQLAYDASAASALPTVCVVTDKGELVLALENVKAPKSVTNFLRYVNEGFYNGTYFHRVSSNFVVQGGGFVLNGSSYVKKTASYGAIPLEAVATTGLDNKQFSVAMARSSALDSATTEFFINTVNNNGATSGGTNLNTSGGGYAVFGQTIFGQTTTLNDIKGVSVTSSTILSGENSQPVTPLALQWAYQIQ
jgi:cyclophilin family peptidyl-prolyl cis-trans isomerase